MSPAENPLADTLIFYRELGVDLLRLPAPSDQRGVPLKSPGEATGPDVGSGPVAQAVSLPDVPAEAARGPLPGGDSSLAGGDSLERIAMEVAACQQCALARTRHLTVPGEGSSRPRILFVGEGPGEEEDLSGRPFVGAAGQLLERILEKMGLSREQVFIGNVVKCRPPGNRNPQPEEGKACMPYLRRQIALLRPRVVVALGRVAASWLLGEERSISSIRGKVFDFEGLPLIPTYHPSYILRQQGREAVSRVKWEVWTDMQKALELSREPVDE